MRIKRIFTNNNIFPAIHLKAKSLEDEDAIFLRNVLVLSDYATLWNYNNDEIVLSNM